MFDLVGSCVKSTSYVLGLMSALWVVMTRPSTGIAFPLPPCLADYIAILGLGTIDCHQGDAGTTADA